MPLGVPQAQGTNPDRDRNCLFIHTLWHVEGQGGIRGIHVNVLFVCHFNSVWGWTTWSFSKRFQSKCGHSQDGQYWILAWQVKWLPQSATDPLTGRWVHSGESQDAPVVGIERIQGTPWSAEGAGLHLPVTHSSILLTDVHVASPSGKQHRESTHLILEFVSVSCAFSVLVGWSCQSNTFFTISRKRHVTTLRIMANQAEPLDRSWINTKYIFWEPKYGQRIPP